MTWQRSIFPPALGAALDAVGNRLWRSVIPADQREQVLAGLDAVSPALIARAEVEIRHRCRLFHPPMPMRPGRGLVGLLLARTLPALPELWLIADEQEAAPLMLFHGDGRVREAALKRLDGGARSPFFFAAVAWRLNDWAVPVRKAAEAAAMRVFPKTDPRIVAEAARSLVGATDSWARWDNEQALLDEAFARVDVAEAVAAILVSARDGPMPRVLRHALRYPATDRHLPALAAGAVIPGVRAVALQALVDRRAVWPTGFGREWIDRSMGKYRRKRLLAERPVETALEPGPLLNAGARDPAVLVRKVAVDALVRRHETLDNAGELLALLLRDPNPVVRARAEFVRRQRDGGNSRSV